MLSARARAWRPSDEYFNATATSTITVSPTRVTISSVRPIRNSPTERLQWWPGRAVLGACDERDRIAHEEREPEGEEQPR